MKMNLFQVLRSVFGVFLATVLTMFSTSISFGNNRITVEPCVFESGLDSYCIIWETSKKGSGYVKYTYNGEEKKAVDSAGGVARSEDTIHRVFVPKAELRDNDYRVGSEYVGFKYAYEAIKGETVESKIYHFSGTPKTDDIKVLCVSDLAGERLLLCQAAKQLKAQPDLIVLLGDICAKLETKADFSEQLLGTASALSGGTVPVAFVRGERETKGEFASQLSKYLPTSTGGLYDTFNFGALSAVVLDTGAEVGGDYARIESYLASEDQWLQKLQRDDFSGIYRLAFRHMPQGAAFSKYGWDATLAQLGFDAVISGHTGTAARQDNAEIPVFTAGGKQLADVRITMLTLKDGTVTVTATDRSGKTVFTDTVDVAA